MDAKVQLYVPRCFNSFQGFSVKDVKEYVTDRRLEIHLQRNEDTPAVCNACGSQLGHYHDHYPMKVNTSESSIGSLRFTSCAISINVKTVKRFGVSGFFGFAQPLPILAWIFHGGSID